MGRDRVGQDVTGLDGIGRDGTGLIKMRMEWKGSLYLTGPTKQSRPIANLFNDYIFSTIKFG